MEADPCKSTEYRYETDHSGHYISITQTFLITSRMKPSTTSFLDTLQVEMSTGDTEMRVAQDEVSIRKSRKVR